MIHKEVIIVAFVPEQEVYAYTGLQITGLISITP